MIVGTVKEIKNHEYRVGLTPESVHELAAHGHRVLVESGAGEGIGAHDALYASAGGEIVASAREIFETAEMIVKVKEPQPEERAMLRPGQILYTYLHLAPDPDQTRDLMASGAICIAYETVTDASGGLPLLKPMSQVAGRMSIQAGATALEKANGGRGVLLGGVPGVLPAKVCVIGGGQIYAQALPLADRLHITHVLAEIEGDTWFPPIDPGIWQPVRSLDVPAGERDSHATRHVVYERRTPRD